MRRNGVSGNDYSRDMSKGHRLLRLDPDRRMEMVVTSAAADFPAEDLPKLDREQLPAWIDGLREAEAATRQLRYKLEALARGGERKCWACGGPVVGRSDRVYCSATCRQRGHRGHTTPEASWWKGEAVTTEVVTAPGE